MKKIRLALLSASFALTLALPPAAFSEAMPFAGGELSGDAFDVIDAASPPAADPADLPGGGMGPAPGFPGGPMFLAHMRRFAPGAPNICPVMGGDPLASLSGEQALSSDQMEKIYKIKSAYADAVGPKKAQMKALERHLQEAMTAESIDQSKVKGIQDQINSLLSDLSSSRVQMELDTMNVLTAAQRKTMHERMVQMSVLGGDGGKCPVMRRR